jgi:hypothetical protein
MYYTYSCVICGRVYYTFNENKQTAAQILYNGFMSHIKEYGEDHSEYDFRESPDKELYKMYYAMKESESVPYGAFMLE